MPRFTLIKHADNQFDSEIKMEFEAEVLDLARAHYEDFLQGAGFELPLKTDAESDFIAKEEDWMWDDAFASKFSAEEVFSFQAEQYVPMDGPVGASGEDVIFIDDYQK